MQLRAVSACQRFLVRVAFKSLCSCVVLESRNHHLLEGLKPATALRRVRSCFLVFLTKKSSDSREEIACELGRFFVCKRTRIS